MSPLAATISMDLDTGPIVLVPGFCSQTVDEITAQKSQKTRTDSS